MNFEMIGGWWNLIYEHKYIVVGYSIKVTNQAFCEEGKYCASQYNFFEPKM